MNTFIILSTVIITILGLVLSIQTFLQTNKKTFNNGSSESALSAKLDALLLEAGVNPELMESLGSSIRNFEDAAKGIAPTVDAMESKLKYSDEMPKANAQMESLKIVYKVHLESLSRLDDEVEENKRVLEEKMEELSKKLSKLQKLDESKESKKV